MVEDERMLSIGEAAKRLHVSPSLLRKWADKGIIRAMRLPGSGYRRFPESEIERMRREMGVAG